MSDKSRNSYYLSNKVQDAMRVIHKVERVSPSNIIDLALIEYLDGKYSKLLKEHGIEI